MEFIKKNYEKIILSLVLLGLVGVLVLMWFVIMADKQQMRDMENRTINRTPQALSPLDLSQEETALARVKSPPDLDFSTTNKLFNPVLWLRAKDGSLIKVVNGHEIGPGAAVVTKITPLYFSITFDSADTNTSSYIFVVQNEAASLPALRHPMRHWVAVGEKINNFFTLQSVEGPPGNPTQLVLQLADTGQQITVSKNHPFQQVEGYTADLKYPPEALTFNAQRVGDQINFAGDVYNIIAIDPNDVIILAQSNQRKFTLPYKP